MKKRFDLQFFNDDAPGSEAEATENGVDKDEKGPQSLDDLLNGSSEFQRAFDKKVEKAIETAKKSWEKAKNEELEKAKSEAEKLAKMNAEEKAVHERQKKEEELTRREQDLIARELKQGAKDLLLEKHLPAELSDLLTYTSAENTKEQVEKLEKTFNLAVENKVNERLKGKTPEAGSTSNRSAMEQTLDQIFN